MTQEARTSAYYPSEMPQPKKIPVENRKTIEKIIPPTQPAKQPNQRSSIANSGQAIMESDRTRASQIKSMISEKMNEESKRQSEIGSEVARYNSERQKIKESGNVELLFPMTTNQEYINNE